MGPARESSSKMVLHENESQWLHLSLDKGFHPYPLFEKRTSRGTSDDDDDDNDDDDSYSFSDMDMTFSFSSVLDMESQSSVCPSSTPFSQKRNYVSQGWE